ncbi:hypothetical protein [Tenacibaculum agarivorans]|uniref:hypothetical protein n=1 Tax=Tenacibaculum agarivorans TaxID=1908389 RepID=UPI00094B923A|nr:hypothetical protein [Tenacibaculum agarivorans]
MKKEYIKLLLTVFVFASCSGGESSVEELIQDESTALKIQDKSNQFNANIAVAYIDPFETKLHWVSFLIAQTLLNHESSRAVFMNVYINSFETTHTIKLEELLDLNNPDLDLFTNAFYQEFDFYNNLSDEELNQVCGRPNLRPIPPDGDPGLAPIDPMALFQAYINSLLHDDCIEIYIPNELDIEIENTVQYTPVIISSAHPLTNASINEAYINRGRCSTEIDEINSTTRENIIIARPYRGLRRCVYTQYSSIKFEDFLGN